MASLGYLLSVMTVFSFASLLSNPIGCYGDYFFVFGDSLWDPGNNQYIESKDPSYYPPYGTTFFNHSTGRHSDGRVLPDFIAVNLNIPFLPPALDPEADFTYGANFASAGAAVDNSNKNAVNFEAQVELFKKLANNWTETLGESEATKRLNNAVYLIAMGGNDYFSYINTENGTSKTPEENQEKVDSVIGNMTLNITDMYKEGARKFAFQNVAPIGCLPMMKEQFGVKGECAGAPLTISRMHNVNLPKYLDKLESELPGFVYTIFDYNNAIAKRIQYPTEYGFKFGDIACCGAGTNRGSSCGSQTINYTVCYDPDEYVFFDGGHNTEKAHSQMAELLWKGDAEYVQPYNLRELFRLKGALETCQRGLASF